MTLRLRRAERGDLPDVEELLSASDLPTDDVRDGDGEFYVGRFAGERVGVGGLEFHGDVGLLRSVAVAEPFRGKGFGSDLVTLLESRARDDGVAELYLLTTTAAGFFADRGYERVDREAVPSAIRGTREFAELCPDSATVMRKSL